jgi:chemotaxis protein histidine kinase CheA/ActR/RegA family two-component response regulator
MAMQSEQQQRIMGYFMEEAQDHLNTIEQGLLNLQSTIEDPETLNEMFRAAHSVKGGAAMLGLNSIHQTAHRLEDYFKVLQDVPLKADTQLESLLLRVFDTLSALLNQLQSYGLTDETASTIMSDAEPVFEQLNSYLKQLAQNKQTAGDTPTVANSSPSSSKGTKTLPATFKRDVLVELREMLQLYKQSDTSEHRRALQDHCQRLIELGDPLNLPGWGELLEISKRAIANLENSYRLLASVTIKEIKQAQELVLTGRSAEIVPSEQLKALAPDATTVESTTAFNYSTHSSPPPTPATEESNQNQKETTHLPDSRDTYIQAEDTYIQDKNGTGRFRRDQLQFSTVQSSNSISPLSDQGEPEVGIAELNSLADIFETQTPDLDQTWQEEEDVINLNDKSLNSDSDDFLDLEDSNDFSDSDDFLDLEDSNDFSDSDDFLDLEDSNDFSDSDDFLDLEDSNDFSDLIGESEDLENSTADDALMQGLGDDFSPDAIANPQASKESSDSLDFSSSLTDDFSDLLFESDSSEDSDQMSHSGDDLNSLFGDGESFFDEEGEASSAEILSHSELEDLDVEENLPQSSLQGDETVSESDFDFDDLLEISSTEENPRPLGESVNQDDLELEDYLESNDLDRENQLDNNNQAETIDIESATPEAGDVSNPFEETSLDDFDQEAWEDSEDLPDFEALNDFFDSEPGVESTPVDSLTEPENDSIIELPTSTDEVLLNESTSSAQKDGDSSESLFEEEGDEILPEVTEDVAEIFAEEGEESQGSTAQVEDFDIDWLTDESQGTQQPWTSETESAANLFGDWETPQAPSNEDLDDLFLFAEEEAEASPSTQSEDLEADWLTDESVETPQPETSDTQADVWEEWETPETTPREDLDDLFAEEEAEDTPSTQSEDLDEDWLTDESVETPQPETSDTQADVWEEWETPETTPREDLDDLFAEEEAEASPSTQSEDLDEDWLTDESVETPQPETSDTQADVWEEWETPETTPREDLDDLFAEEEAEATPSTQPEDLEADWLTDESVETPQPETSDSAADIFGDWDIPETPSREDLDDLFAEEEAEATPSTQPEDLDEDWLTDESVETPQPETSDSAADIFGDEEIPETASREDLDDLFAEEEAEAAPSTQPEDLEADWLTDESQEIEQPETSDTQADVWEEWDIPETASREDLDDLFAEEEAEASPSTQPEDLDEDWLTDESVETPQPETSDSAADIFGDEEIPETASREDLDDLFAEEEAEAAPSTQPEDLEADWLTDESQEIEQPETSDTQADVWEEWDIPETASREDLDDLFAEEEAEASPSTQPEDLDEDWLTDESVETPQPETSGSAADLFGDWDIPETPSDEDLDDLFAEEEAEASPSTQPEDLDEDWLTDESVETPQPETSDSAADLFGDWDIPETASREDLDDLFAQEEAEAAPSADLEDLDEDWLTDESVETPQPETSDSAADLFGDWDIPETASREDLDDLFAQEEAEAAPSADLEDLDEDWLTDESVETPQPETSDSAADLFGDWDIPETPSDEDLDELFSLEEATVDDDFSLATLAETEWDLDSPREGADEFADLETMLDGETSAALTSESDNEFADLETMLDGETSAALISESDNEFAELDAMLDGETSAALISESDNEFAELDAMLDGETSAALTSESGNEFADLEAMLVDTPSQTDSCEDLEIFLGEQESTQDNRASVAQTPPSQDKDDLDKELEALLQDAESRGGPATTTNTGSRQTAPLPSRRPPRIFEQTMRVPVKHLDSLNNLVGELVVSRNSLEQDQERLRQFLDNLQHQVSALSDVGARMRDLYERSLLESSLLASSSSQNQPRDRSLFGSENGASASTDSESAEDYHPLEMDRFTGFHLLSQEMIELIVQVRESASDVEFLVDETDQVARNLRQVTTQLQEGLTRSRMVPFANAADRLTRPVREISRKLSKEAQLQVEGRETLLDKMILEHLYDPLTHLVNNAITHGIESPEERQEMGKPAVGQIILRAFHQGNQTVIAISDDGAGIDPEQIKRKAIEKKLITPAEAKDLTNTELYDFLFHPGFSTKDEASEFAGRGVGMDVVRTSLSEIRGAIYIDSTLGKGTTFTIRLPLTLSICKALCCLSTRARIAFPMDGVEDMFDVPKDRLQKDANGQVGVSWRDTLVSVQPLSELLSYNRSISRGNVYGGKREDDLVSIVVLRSSGTFIAIEVDQVLGEQEIVIKQLEGPPPKPIGIAGATVLGDGRIMPIADVLELIDLASGRLRKDSVTIWSRGDSEGAGIEEAPETPHEPLVLIVDDSITVRELLSMTFAKAGYRVEQSRDGQEAWDKLRSGLPCDIVFCDIEMPRMDGLELLSRLQKDENLSQLPIAMLTSRGAKRHRQMAAQLGASGYFTKPYLEEVLLDAAQRMIQGEVLFSASEA